LPILSRHDLGQLPASLELMRMAADVFLLAFLPNVIVIAKLLLINEVEARGVEPLSSKPST